MSILTDIAVRSLDLNLPPHLEVFPDFSEFGYHLAQLPPQEADDEQVWSGRGGPPRQRIHEWAYNVDIAEREEREREEKRAREWERVEREAREREEVRVRAREWQEARQVEIKEVKKKRRAIPLTAAGRRRAFKQRGVVKRDEKGRFARKSEDDRLREVMAWLEE